jgi:hypothetical protein
VRRAAASLLGATLLLSGGCVTYVRGNIDLAAPETPDIELTTVAESVEGRSCGKWVERQYEHAADQALAQAPGADALADVRYRFEDFCIVVRGRAVKIVRD